MASTEQLYKPERPKNILTLCEGDYLNLHLSTDSNARIATHSNELFARVGLLIFLWIIATIPWLINIDTILDYFVGTYNPCSNDCLNLYQPEKWSELRWIISAFLGFISILPLFNWQIWTFSKPGLTMSERKLLKYTLILCPVLFIITGYLTVIELLPNLYHLGHEIHSQYGLIAKYDAVSVIYFATMLMWIQVLIITACSIMISAGITGNLDKSNANWWRIRVYGFTSLVSILSFYERTSYGLVITITIILLVELICRRWTNKQPKYDVDIDKEFSSNGEIISVLNINCNCLNQKVQMEKQFLTLEDVCRVAHLQDDLLKIIANYQPNKMIIHCCDNIPVWQSLNEMYANVEIECK